MREDNIAFKKKLQESRLRAARRLQLQRTGGFLLLSTCLLALYIHYL